MLSFLFWNLGGNPVHHRAARAVEHHGVDILMLAESHLRPQESLAELNRTLSRRFHLPLSFSERLQVFTRAPRELMSSIFDDVGGRLTIRRLITAKLPDILLAVLHFQSKVNWTDEEQFGEAGKVAREIARAEEELGHQRTVLVGDLNMHPFDKGVVSAHGFHGVMAASIAARTSRQVGDRKYPFFYNPMWGLLGDRTPGPPGTHYLSRGGPITYFWSTLDQMLLRPSLMHSLAEVCILNADGTESLLTRNGLPDRTGGSDHLPLLFRLDV